MCFFFTQYTSTLCRCIKKYLKTLALTGADKSMMENFTGEKEKKDKKGNDKHKDADSLLHNIKAVPNFCIKFQSPRCRST